MQECAAAEVCASRNSDRHSAHARGQVRISVGVVDDCALFREGVVLALAASDGIELVDQGGTIGEALRIAYEKRPDFVLLSINTPDPEFAAVTALCSVSPKTKVVVLLLSASEDAVKTALKAGARAYILKSVIPTRKKADSGAV